MARSENQGLQIAVIIFAFLTIALSVGTFYFFNDASTKQAEVLAERQKADDNNKVARNLVDEKRVLLENVIGHPYETTPANAQAKRDEVASFFTGLQLAPTGKNYVNILQSLKTWCDQCNQERKDQKQKIDELEKQLLAIKATYDADVKKTADKYDGENKRLSTEVVTLNNQATEQQNKFNQVSADLDKVRADLVKAIDDKRAELLAKDKEIATVRAQMAEVIKERYEKENWVFERPDATIVSVNPREQTVNIDVGRADFLRLNIQFAVFKEGETNVYKRTKKGTVAITQFIGDDMAVARIVESDLKDPVLPGDVVYTPTWTPGTQETFVLAGDFEINGDRKPDNELMRDLVDINGGKVQDEVGTDTRYVILGDQPLASEKEHRADYDKKKTRAKELSIKIMGLPEFIEYTGSTAMISELRKLGTNKDSDKVLQSRPRELAKQGFRARPAPDGGSRRVEPGTPRAQPSGAAKEPARKTRGGQ